MNYEQLTSNLPKYKISGSWYSAHARTSWQLMQAEIFCYFSGLIIFHHAWNLERILFIFRFYLMLIKWYAYWNLIQWSSIRTLITILRTMPLKKDIPQLKFIFKIFWNLYYCLFHYLLEVQPIPPLRIFFLKMKSYCRFNWMPYLCAAVCRLISEDL